MDNLQMNWEIEVCIYNNLNQFRLVIRNIFLMKCNLWIQANAEGIRLFEAVNTHSGVMILEYNSNLEINFRYKFDTSYYIDWVWCHLRYERGTQVWDWEHD